MSSQRGLSDFSKRWLMWLGLFVLVTIIASVIISIGISKGVRTWQLNSALQEKARAAFAAKPGEIQSITLLPIDNKRFRSPIVARMRITDADDIEEIRNALSEARTCVPNHPNPTWDVLMDIECENGTVRVKVKRTLQDDNGTLMYVYSDPDGQHGWNLGTYRADSLGTIIERLSAKTDEAGQSE